MQSVNDQSELLDRVFSLLNGIRNATIVVALVQAFAALLLISNMVQIAAFTRRTETNIMRLVGASRWRTQLPFMIEAIVAGLIGAVLAIGGLIAGQGAVRRQGAGLGVQRGHHRAGGQPSRSSGCRRSWSASAPGWPRSRPTSRCGCTSGL